MSVDYLATDGTATLANNDYQPASGTISIPPKTLTGTITVVVNGDTKFEPNEDFIVKLTSATNATITDFEGTGTISNDDGQPSISIDDVKVVEGNGGTTNAVFTVSLTNTSDQKVSVDYQTVDGRPPSPTTTTQPTGGTLSIPPKTSTATITVVVNGDTKNEDNEDFSVVLSGAVNATIQDNQGTGTISNTTTRSR